jgi:hypothetical protein
MGSDLGVVVSARRRRPLCDLDRRRWAGALVPCLRVHRIHEAVCRRVGLRAPPLREGAEVDRVVADLVEELADDLLRLVVVASDGEGAAVVGARGAGESREVLEEDVVEALDYVGVGQMGLEQRGAGGRLVVKLGDVPLPMNPQVAMVTSTARPGS